MTRPPRHGRHTVAAFIQAQLHTSQRRRRPMTPPTPRIPQQRLRPVITGENHQRVPTPRRLQTLQKPPKMVIELCDIAIVQRLARLLCTRIPVHEFGAGRNRLVRRMEAQEQVDRLLLRYRLHPRQRLVHHHLARITLQRPHLFAIPYKVIRVLVRWPRVVLRAEPVVKAVVPRLRLLRRIELPIRMPLPRMTSCIARVSQHPRKAHLVPPQMHLGPRRNPVIYTQPIRRAARQHPASRRAAHWRRRVRIGELHPLSRKRVQIRRLDRRMPKTTQVAVPQVVT